MLTIIIIIIIIIMTAEEQTSSHIPTPADISRTGVIRVCS
jgi:hypothetical protein